MQTLRHHHHQAEHPEQTRRCSLNRPHTPMPLRFQTQVRPDLFESDFDVPAAHIEADYLLGGKRATPSARTKEDFSINRHFARTFVGPLVAHHPPAYGKGFLSGGIPKTNPREIPNLLNLPAIP